MCAAAATGVLLARRLRAHKCVYYFRLTISAAASRRPIRFAAHGRGAGLDHVRIPQSPRRDAPLSPVFLCVRAYCVQLQRQCTRRAFDLTFRHAGRGEDIIRLSLPSFIVGGSWLAHSDRTAALMIHDSDSDQSSRSVRHRSSHTASGVVSIAAAPGPPVAPSATGSLAPSCSPIANAAVDPPFGCRAVAFRPPAVSVRRLITGWLAVARIGRC